ncbi:MAG: ATP-binding protein [Proteobacteria bacterium]|nr:ATP-binding protein [Pseudomonadota bacterium]
MKNVKIGAAIIVILLLATTLSAFLLTSYEKKRQVQDIKDKGTYLVNLISLYPIKDFSSERRDFFLRTLMESTMSQGILYLIIHNETGQSFISLVPAEISSQIPENIQTASVQATTLTTQIYRPQGLPYTVYEFAKSIFSGGQKIGIVRLGLRLPSITMLSKERASLITMIAFFIFIALLVAYYGMNSALRSLKEMMNRRNHGQDMDAGHMPIDQSSSKGEQVIPILRDLERSLAGMDYRLSTMTEDNLKLISKLGASSFEKNQIINVLDSINFGIVVTDFQDHVTLINEYMLKLINKSRENIINSTLEHIFPQKEVIEFISRNEMGESTMGRNAIETEFPDHAAGENFQISLSRLASGERTAIGKMISVRNITGINIAKRAQQEFIAHVAHELRTPLTNIRAYTEMLMDGEVDNPEMQKEFYNTISLETNRLTSLIENLLNMSRMEMGNITLNKGLLRTEWLVSDCFTTIEVSAQSKGITFEKQLPDNLPNFIADKELIKTAIINILGNAVKYTPENGNIRFSMEELGGSIIFDIEDSGYGMSQEDIPHVFEKFYRSGNSEITAQTGSGLGLAIAHEIIHLHDGEIEVQSKLGEGSRFTIRLPKEEYIVGKA